LQIRGIQSVICTGIRDMHQETAGQYASDESSVSSLKSPALAGSGKPA